MNPTIKKTKAVETKGVKAFRFEKGVLSTGGIGNSKHTEFKEGETYEVQGEPDLCGNGFHFYEVQNGCFGAQLFGETTIHHEIIAYGEVVSDTEKCVCTKIKVGKKVNLDLDGDSNSGYRNSGDRNSGDSNSGDRNSGDSNSGDRNSGDRNSGNSNSGCRNSGNWNSGYRNSGCRNSGNWNSGDSNSGDSNSGYSNSGYSNSGDSNSGNSNSGDRNSGDRNSGNSNSGCRNSGNWNSCNREVGCFNSVESKTIRVFNKQINREEWDNAEKPDFLYFDMQANESYKDAFRRSWRDTTPEDRALLENLPGFNWAVFTEISGIEKPSEDQ